MRRLVSALGALAITAITLTGILALDRPPEAPPTEPRRDPVAFEIAPAPKPPPARKPPPPPRTPPKTPPPPAALLSASLSGLSFGLAAFDGAALGASDAVLGGAGADVVMTEATVDEAPRPIRQSAPQYPARARARDLEGHVLLSVLIGEDGSVQDVQVLDADPPHVFEDAAREAVRAWRFQPARYQGRAVAIRVQQTIRFTLE